VVDHGVPDAFDRLASTLELGAIGELSMSELRQRRSDLQAIEQALSYVRRLAQGRLDILIDEQAYRAGGSGARDASALVASLPKILSEHVAGGGNRGALPEVDLPAGNLAEIDEILASVDHMIDARQISDLNSVSSDDLTAAIDGLTAIEHRVSQVRRSFHTPIDALQQEIVRRYKSGEASVDALLS
jgi:multidrug efflux pump subunit AcrA (membrane-fusion protein)